MAESMQDLVGGGVGAIDQSQIVQYFKTTKINATLQFKNKRIVKKACIKNETNSKKCALKNAKEGDTTKAPQRGNAIGQNRNNPIHTIKGQHDYNCHVGLLQYVN